MNNEKPEILLCGPKKYVESSDCDHICIEGENISFSDNVRNLGVYFDCTFSMEHHVQQLCKSLFFELRKISHMRAFLNEASLQKLVTSFVLSRMDYCNSLLVKLPNDTITKLQRIQNHAARLVLKKARGQRGRVVSASDSGSGARGFDSQPSHVVIALGKQFTPTFPSPPTCKMGTQLQAMSL